MRKMIKIERHGAKQTLLAASGKGAPYWGVSTLAIIIYNAYSLRRHTHAFR